MRLLALVALAWLTPAVLFLGWAATVAWADHLEERAEWAELREQERRQAAYRRMGGAT